MLAVGVAVPVLVSLEAHVLVSLVVGELVRTVGQCSLNAGVVGRSPNAVVLREAGLIKILIYKPVRGKAVKKVEAGQRLGKNHSDLVVAGLVKTNGSLVFNNRVVSTYYEVVVSEVSGLVPSLGSNNRSEQSKVLIGQRDSSVRVHHVNEGFPVGHVEVSSSKGINIALEGISAKVRKNNIKSDVHLLAVSIYILSVLILGEVGKSVGAGCVSIGSMTSVSICLCACDGEVLRIVVNSAVVLELGVKKSLHRINI